MKKIILPLAILGIFAPMLFAQSKSAQDAFDALDNEQQKASVSVQQQQPAPKPVVKAVSSPAVAPASAKPVTTPAQSEVVKETKSVASNKRIEVKDNVVSFIGEDGKAVKTIQLKDEQKNDAEYVLVNRVLAFPAANKQYIGIATEHSRVLPEYSIVSTTTFQYYGVDGNVLWNANNVVLEYTPPAIYVSNDGSTVIISTGIRPENVDLSDFPQNMSMYDRKGKTVLKIGDFTGTNDPIVTKNDKYFYFMFSRDSLYGYKFVNLKKRTVIEYVFDDKHEGGHVEIDDNGKVSFYHIEAKVLDETVTPFKVKETETLIDTLQIK